MVTLDHQVKQGERGHLGMVMILQTQGLAEVEPKPGGRAWDVSLYDDPPLFPLWAPCVLGAKEVGRGAMGYGGISFSRNWGVMRRGVSNAETHADGSAGGGLNKEWHSCIAMGIPDARSGLSTPINGCVLLAFLTSEFGLWCWTWMPLHMWWTPTQRPLRGGAVVPP